VTQCCPSATLWLSSARCSGGETPSAHFDPHTSGAKSPLTAPNSYGGISFVTSKTAPCYAHLACSRHCEMILYRRIPGGPALELQGGPKPIVSLCSLKISFRCFATALIFSQPVSFPLRVERVDGWERNVSRGDRPSHPLCSWKWRPRCARGCVVGEPKKCPQGPSWRGRAPQMPTRTAGSVLECRNYLQIGKRRGLASPFLSKRWDWPFSCTNGLARERDLF